MSVVVTRAGAELMRLEGSAPGDDGAALAALTPALGSLNAALPATRLMAHAARETPWRGDDPLGGALPLSRDEMVETLLRTLAGHLAREGRLRCPGDPDPEGGVAFHVHLGLLARLMDPHAPPNLAAQGGLARATARALRPGLPPDRARRVGAAVEALISAAPLPRPARGADLHHAASWVVALLLGQCHDVLVPGRAPATGGGRGFGHRPRAPGLALGASSRLTVSGGDRPRRAAS